MRPQNNRTTLRSALSRRGRYIRPKTGLYNEKATKELEKKVLRNCYFLTSSGDANSKIRGVSGWDIDNKRQSETLRIINRKNRNYKFKVVLFFDESCSEHIEILDCKVDDMSLENMAPLTRSLVLASIKDVDDEKRKKLTGYGVVACFNDVFSMKVDEEKLLDQLIELNANSLCHNTTAFETIKNKNAHIIDIHAIREVNNES